jgi:hypothetical protein
MTTALSTAARLLGPNPPAYPSFPPLGTEALADAERVRAGRFRLVGEEYELGAEFSWTVNPSHDKEWQIAQHKHYWAVHLVHAARETGDPAYLRTWSRLVTSWLDEMGSGHIASSDAQVEAKRVESWVWALSLLPAAPWRDAVDPALVDRLVTRIGEEAAYVATHLKTRRNHRTFQLYAVALAAVLLPELDRDGRLRHLSTDRLARNLLTDLGPDGVHVEMSTHYHQLVTETAVGFLELCDRNGVRVRPALRERVHAALRWSMWLQWPDGSIPLIGDSDDGDHRDLLRRGSLLYGDDELRYAATLGAEGAPPTVPSRHLPASGYLVATDGWGRDEPSQRRRQHLLFDTAVLGEGSHSHYDLLSFTYFAGGGPAVVDPGRFTYSSEPDLDGQDWRHYFKSTEAHNTVTVDGLDQTRYLSRTKHGPDVLVQDAAHHLGRDTDWAAASACSHEYTPLHRRLLLFPRRRYLLVVDHVQGLDGEPHTYDLRFHLPGPQATLRGRGTEVRLTSPRAVIVCAPPANAHADVLSGWVSRRYGEKEPAAVLTVAHRTEGEAWFASTVAPTGGVLIEHVQRSDTAGAVWFCISGRDGGEQFEDHLVVPRDGELVLPGLHAAARWVLVHRDRRGRAVHAVGHQVRRLRLDGVDVPVPADGELEWSAGGGSGPADAGSGAA